jgi:hypothetical protein
MITIKIQREREREIQERAEQLLKECGGSYAALLWSLNQPPCMSEYENNKMLLGCANISKTQSMCVDF